MVAGKFINGLHAVLLTLSSMISATVRRRSTSFFQRSLEKSVDSLSVTSLFFCKINQAAAFLRKSSGNATSLRHKDAAMICFPGFVTLHLRVRGILAINFWAKNKGTGYAIPEFNTRLNRASHLLCCQRLGPLMLSGNYVAWKL
jgi:hypothetical protein